MRLTSLIHLMGTMDETLEPPSCTNTSTTDYISKVVYVNCFQIFCGSTGCSCRWADTSWEVCVLWSTAVYETGLPSLLSMGQWFVSMQQMWLASLLKKMWKESWRTCKWMCHLSIKEIQVKLNSVKFYHDTVGAGSRFTKLKNHYLSVSCCSFSGGTWYEG